MPLDTAPDAHEVQGEIYRRLGGRGRLAVTFRLNDAVRRLGLSGIRARHPDYNESQVQQAYARLLHGDAIARAAWPDRELVDP